MMWQLYDFGSKGRFGESFQIILFVFISWIMNEWSWYMGMFFNMIECSYNRNVFVNFYMLLVNLMIKYFNDILQLKVLSLMYLFYLKIFLIIYDVVG